MDYDADTECGEEYVNEERAGGVVIRPDGLQTHEALGDEGTVMNTFAHGCATIFLTTLHTDLLEKWCAGGTAVRRLVEMIQPLQDHLLKPLSKVGDVGLTTLPNGTYEVDVYIRERSCKTPFSRPSSPVLFPVEW